MIISKTPFRISFIGGGTDLPLFYQHQQGAVISTTIDKYVYITVNRRFDESLRVSYSKTEITGNVNEIIHPIFREIMKETGVDKGVEITSIADIPAGTGMGSSSSFTVGLFNALQGFVGKVSTAQELAQKACHLEIDILGEPIGKQDQYAAAFGGLKRYLFNSDGSVSIDPVICSSKRRREFFNHLMLFYIGGTRNASSVLGKISDPSSNLHSLRNLVNDFWTILTTDKDLRQLGEILHRGWEQKKQMSVNITNPAIDECYDRARMSGALGGKILGAGAAGFLLLFCEPKNKYSVCKSLPGIREIPFEYEPEGSKIIYAE